MPAFLVAALVEVGISTAIATFAVNFALSYVVTRIFGSKPPQQQDNGVRQQIPPSNDNTIPVVYGDAWLGGTFVDAVLSTDAKTMYYVLVISHISPNGQFTYDTTKFYYGDRLITFDGTDLTKVASLTDGAGNVDTKIAGKIYINLYTSTAGGTITSSNGAAAPSTVMGGADIDAALRWTGTRQMNGLAFAIIKVNYDVQAGSTGLQPVTFKVSHTLNSTGVAKPGDVLYDYLTSTVYGGAVPAANVNSTACTALNTYSDQNITYTPSGGGSATQARYRINGVINTGETVLNNVDKICTACDSWISYQTVSGQWTPIVNREGVTAFAFDDSNIMGEIRVSATDISQSVNQIEVSFPNKDNKDQPNYVYLKTPSNLLYPNEPVNKYSGSFDLVNDSVQAQYLANRVLEQAREDLIVGFNTAYPGIQVDVGDVVSVTNDAYGWSAKLFRVMRVTEVGLPEGGLGAQFELYEYNAQIYDDKDITQFTPAPNSNISSAYYFPSLTAPTFSDQAPSAQPPTFSVTCSLPSTVRITTVTLYYTKTATPTVSDWIVWEIRTASNAGAFDPGSSIKFSNVIVGSGTYYFAFTVGNEVSTSTLSATSAAFSWTTVTPSGPTGPTGTTGPTGSTGPTGAGGGQGPRNALVYFFYNTPQSTTPTAPTTGQVSYNFSTGTGSITASGWSATFNPSAVGTTTANNKFWAISATFQESTYGGSYTTTLSSVFTWQNMDGLVTFTNLANSIGPLGTNTTFIDGGSITTNTLNVNRIVSSAAAILTGRTFGLGTGASAFGYGGTVIANTTDATASGMLSVGGSNTYAGFAVVGATADSGAGTAGGAFGNATSTGYTSWRSYGLIGQASQAGTFYNGISGTTGLIANATYAFYSVSGGYGPFTGEHDALLPKGTTIAEGDIVYDTGFVVAKDLINVITQVNVTNQPNENGVVGIFHQYSANKEYPTALTEQIIDPNTGLQKSVIKPEYLPLLEQNDIIIMASIGEGMINVCGENGDIAVGDLIVSSSTPGKGMKQADNIVRSTTVGKARQAATFSSPTDIQQIACIYMCG